MAFFISRCNSTTSSELMYKHILLNRSVSCSLLLIGVIDETVDGLQEDEYIAGGSFGKIKHNVSTALMHNTPGRSNCHVGPHRSFTVTHRTTYVTKTLRIDQLCYSKYCSISTLLKNGQFVIKTDYVIC